MMRKLYGCLVVLVMYSSLTLADARSDSICITPDGEESFSSLACFKALLADPAIKRKLKNPAIVPGISDGRLTIKEIKQRLRGSDLIPADINGHSTDRDYDPHFDDLIDQDELDELRRNKVVKVKAQINHPQGPIIIQNYPQIPPGGYPIPKPPIATNPENPNYLDISGFLNELHATLSPNVNGYAMRMRKDGTTVGALQWNWARAPGDAPVAGWNATRNMHVASVSKFMSTIGLIHLLHDQGIATNTPIINYLPQYWQIPDNSNIDLITFEDLMNHFSGFSTGGSSSSWATMQANVEAGVSQSDIGTFDYENMNFGLIRILIATISGVINPSANFGDETSNDSIWSFITVSGYQGYMNNYVFNPAGAFPTLNRNLTTTLAYSFDGVGGGWNSGNLAASAGGFAWYMTIDELLDVLRTFRSGQIVSYSNVAKILKQSFGLDSPTNGFTTDAGNLYYKSGSWTDSSNPPKREQSVIMLLPNNIELALFVNSGISVNNSSLRGVVRSIYMNNIVIASP